MNRGVVAMLLHVSPFASRREYEGLLRFILPAGPEIDQEVQRILKQFCSSFYLIAMREAIQGESLEFSYQVRLLDPTLRADLIHQLTSIKEVEDATLMMQRSTIEI